MTDHRDQSESQELRQAIHSLSGELAGAWTAMGKLTQAFEDCSEALNSLRDRVRALEQDTPYARQMQAELDATLADNAADGYGEWGPE